MLFKTDLAVKIITGAKTETRRWTPHMPVGPGKTFFAQLKLFDTESRFAQLQAVSVYEWNPLNLTKAVAKAEGFDSPSEFSKAYQAINAHKSYKTKSGKWRVHWAVEFRVVNLLWNPILPDPIKEALREQSKWCGCGDSFFPVNVDTSDKQCNTCVMLDKMQIDENIQAVQSLRKQIDDEWDAPNQIQMCLGKSIEIKALADQNKHLIKNNYTFESFNDEPTHEECITQAHVDNLFVCQQER